jgi:hypothetical protein
MKAARAIRPASVNGSNFDALEDVNLIASSLAPLGIDAKAGVGCWRLCTYVFEFGSIYVHRDQVALKRYPQQVGVSGIFL